MKYEILEEFVKSIYHEGWCPVRLGGATHNHCECIYKKAQQALEEARKYETDKMNLYFVEYQNNQVTQYFSGPYLVVARDSRAAFKFVKNHMLLSDIILTVHDIPLNLSVPNLTILPKLQFKFDINDASNDQVLNEIIQWLRSKLGKT